MHEDKRRITILFIMWHGGTVNQNGNLLLLVPTVVMCHNIIHVWISIDGWTTRKGLTERDGYGDADLRARIRARGSRDADFGAMIQVCANKGLRIQVCVDTGSRDPRKRT